MRLVFVIGQISTKGGVERIWVDRANYLAEECGHEVWIINMFQREDEENAYELSSLIHNVRLGKDFTPSVLMKRNPLRFVREWLEWRMAYKNAVCSSIENIQPDVIFCATYLDIGIDYGHTRAKLIAESHAVRSEDTMAKGSGWVQRWNKYWLKRNLEKHADVMVCLTARDAACWKGNVKIIPNFTNVKRKRPADYCKHRAIAVGRLCEQKGFDILVHAWRKVAQVHPDWHLDIFGEGQYWGIDPLPETIKQCGMESHVHLCGCTDDIAEAFASHSFFVFPSRWEGFGLALLEAMTCGLPAVSTDCPYGPREIMCGDKADTDCGILVPVEDADALADAIIYMIEHPEVRERMGNAAIEKAKRFDKHKVMKMWNDLLEDIVSK